VVLAAHGDRRVDEYHWLRDREDPQVLAHLEAENAYTDACTAHLSGLRERLYEEIVGRILETDLSVPVRKGPFAYYSRTEAGRQYPIRCRRPLGPGGEGPEQVLLDENALAPDGGYLALGAFDISPDHRLLAYSVDRSGAERFALAFLDLETGRPTGEVIEDTYFGAVWAADGRTVFYTRPDAAMRPFQLWRYQLGLPGSHQLVYEEPDERFHLGVQRTKDDAFVVVSCQSRLTTEARLIDARRPLEEPRLLERRRQGVEYSLGHLDGRFLILTNDEAEDFRLVEAPDSDPSRASWRELVAHRPGVRLESVEEFRSHLALFERAEGVSRLSVVDLADGSRHVVPQPEEVCAVWPGPNPELDSTVVRYEYSSLVTPRSVYDYDMAARRATLLKRQPVLGGYDPADYECGRLWAEAPDGTAVPVSFVHRKGLRRDGTAPALLYGYGAYEACVDPTFSALRLPLLDRGFVFAIAHVRGGGELGRRWYEQGRLEAKPNTFSDFVAAAQALVSGAWTSPFRLVARGGSAGGLLIGAVANQAPQLFRAMVAEVPFVDCLTTISDESLPLSAMEWEEWGDPRKDPAIYRAMRSYSPYDNVRPQRYPDVLATAGLNDPRVSYWEPAKWVLRLRQVDPFAQVLLKTELGAGHQGPSGRYDAWRDEAFVLAFVLDRVGLGD
jgi:oligopeptidase B